MLGLWAVITKSSSLAKFTRTVVVRKLLSLELSKFQNYDPLTMTQIHTQLNYKCKLQVHVDKAAVVKPEALKCTLGSHDCNYVHGKCRL